MLASVSRVNLIQYAVILSSSVGHGGVIVRTTKYYKSKNILVSLVKGNNLCVLVLD